VTDHLFSEPERARGLTREDIMTAKDVAEMLCVPVSTAWHATRGPAGAGPRGHIS
jgi:hypothetical protein